MKGSLLHINLIIGLLLLATQPIQAQAQTQPLTTRDTDVQLTIKDGFTPPSDAANGFLMCWDVNKLDQKTQKKSAWRLFLASVPKTVIKKQVLCKSLIKPVI